MDLEDIKKIHKITGNVYLILGILLLPVSFISYHSIELIRYFLRVEEYISVGPFHFFNPLNFMYLLPVIYGSLAILMGLSGVGIMMNKNWAKKLALIPAVIFMFFFPIGTIIGGFIIYVILEERKIQHA